MHVVSQLLPLCVCQNSFKPTFLRLKGLSRKKEVRPKRSNVTRCWTYSASNDKNLESRGAYENETLHVVSQLPLLYVYMYAKFDPNWTLSSVKRLARRKRPEPKKQILRDARPTLFLIKKFSVKGNVGSWDSACSLVNYLHYVNAKVQPNRTTFRVKGWQRKKWSNEKAQNWRDARPTLLPMTKSRVKGSLRKWNFAYS